MLPRPPASRKREGADLECHDIDLRAEIVMAAHDPIDVSGDLRFVLDKALVVDDADRHRAQRDIQACVVGHLISPNQSRAFDSRESSTESRSARLPMLWVESSPHARSDVFECRYPAVRPTLPGAWPPPACLAPGLQPGPPAEFREARSCLPPSCIQTDRLRRRVIQSRRPTGQVVLVKTSTPWVRSACLSSAPQQPRRRASTLWEMSGGHAVAMRFAV